MTSGRAAATDRRSVVVVHPVHQHAYESAVAADESGRLLAFCTGVYIRPALLRAATLAERFVPGAHGLADQLLRRHHRDLDPARVRRFAAQPWWGLARQRILGRAAPAFSSTWLEAFDRRAARWVRRTRPALVHVFDYKTPQTLATARALGIRTVLDVTINHEEACAFFPREGGCEHLARLSQERADADVLLAGSPYVAAGLVDNGVKPERVRVLAYGADTALFHPGDAHRPEVVMVGQLTRRKGLDLLLEAWAGVDAPGWTLRLIGTPDAGGQELLDAAPRSVVVTTHLPRHLLAAEMGGASIFVLPSRAEGSALVVYEAMAAGLAVVTTPQAGSVITSGEDGLVVAPDAAAVAAALQSLVDDEPARVAMAAAARRTIVEGFTWEHYRRRLSAVYEELLSA